MDPVSVQQQTQPSQYFNFTTESGMGESEGRERDSITFFIAPILITFFALGFIGNVIILHTVCAVRRFHRVENLMLANLSTLSVVTTISTMLVYIQMTLPFNFYGPFYCNFFPGAFSFAQPAEGFTMMSITLERTQRVRFPLRRATKLSTIKKIALIWFLALLLDLPRGFLFYTYDPDMESLLKCRNTRQLFGTWIPYAIYMATNYFVTFLLPSVWLARDWIRLASQLHFLIAFQTLPLHDKYRRRQRKLVRHALIFTSIFIAVKVPVGTHFFLHQLPSQLLSETLLEWVKTWKQFFFSVSILHGCFYPFIIFSLSRDIRKHLLCCKFDPGDPPDSG